MFTSIVVRSSKVLLASSTIISSTILARGSQHLFPGSSSSSDSTKLSSNSDKSFRLSIF